MPSRWGNDLRCDVCGLCYSALRTGLKFADVVRMMRVSSEDSTDWRYKRRHGVLGLWHQLKLSEWSFHVAQCSHYAEAAA